MLEPTAVLLAHADGTPASTAFTCGSLDANDPFDRQIAYVGTDNMAAGVVQASGQFSVDHYPYSETIVVHAGRVILQSQDHALELNPGDSAVIARGTSVQIDALPGSFWAFCADTQPVETGTVGLTALPPYSLLSPSTPPSEEFLLSPTPQCRSNNVFVEDATNLRIGIWDSTPYVRKARPHTMHELMHLIEGRIILQIADGSELAVNTGDTVFVPRGAPCAWKSSVYVRKFYVCK
ncbi:cupin domain-containing protein [Pseudomonas sp. NFACC37-1]|uniref:cupin domain-containing protein n=1 Tax=Pseudomonas sp. NFACC37-1 TaxID=1566196 RepID=UPI0008848BD3|nr:cupin domain-containing protein [Pseudomonas sp. NFACC37-1]SCX77963.1 Predicted enzyme of the cupin superfamily [Pseudomonas sp. NFACC37-1]